ncbi:MAG TPA: hypothetical protein VJ623_15125 [Holophagaceae bacterium]|nr:hypothetical protein [Holophagaceae bacterium]
MAGFTPSYFAVLRTTDGVHHFHGLTATAWLVLLVLQSWLFKTQKLAWHRRLGRLSLALVPLFLLSGGLVVRTMLQARNGFNLAFGPRLAAVDVIALFTFASAYALALRHRHELKRHARWMISTALLVLPPALARLLPPMLGLASFETAFHSSFLLTELAVGVLLVQDRKEPWKVRAPYLALLASLLLQQGLFVVLPCFR